MNQDNVEKIIKQAEANSNVENEKLDKKYLEIIKDALETKEADFFENAYKIIKKEKQNERKDNK